MEKFPSQVMTRAIESVQLPMEHFLKTGFYDESIADECYGVGIISREQVRRACRQMAEELKRPFILCGSNTSKGEYDNYAHKYIRYENPKWINGYFIAPKKKYLSPLVAPFILASDSDWVQDRSYKTIFHFVVTDRKLWDEYYKHLLEDPACRATRKLSPL